MILIAKDYWRNTVTTLKNREECGNITPEYLLKDKLSLPSLQWFS